MADTATLQPIKTSSKKTGPVAMIGGTFEDVFETITGSGQGYVTEKPKQETQNSSEQKANKAPMASNGSIEFNSIKARELSQEISKAAADKAKKEALQARRAEVNAKIGIGNLSYEDTVSEDFILRADVQADLDKANSELSKEEHKNKKENIIAQVTGKVDRIARADMNRNFEDQNMAGPG